MFNFVKIIPVEDTFFVREEIPENIKLSRNIIKLNYMDKSPFKEGDLIFFQKGNTLYIWFTRYKLEDNKVYIPESYLIAKNSHIKNGFILYKKKNSFSILVVKNKDLLSQISYKKEPSQLDLKLKLLAKEYSIKDPEIYKVEKPQYKYDYKDIILFSRVELTKENILRIVLGNITVPLGVFFIGLSIYKVADYYYLMNTKENLKKEYISLKNKNSEIKEKIRLAQEKKEFWDSFIKRELNYPIAPNVIYNIAKVVLSYEGFISDIAYSPGLVSMTIGLPKKREKFIENLMKTGLFKGIKITATAPDRLSKDYEVLNMELYLKELIKDEKG